MPANKSTAAPVNVFFKKINLQHIPTPIWALSISALLMTLSGSIVFTIAPHYLVDILKLNKESVGWMEGIVESISLFVRIFSGVISDYFSQRKSIILLGYGLSTLAKIALPFSFGVGALYAARIVERIGNGLQAAPREALVGDLAPAKIRGACYGMRNAFGKAGSSLGALAVFIILFYVSSVHAGTYQFIFFVGIIPSVLACIILYVFVKDKPQRNALKNKSIRFPLKWSELKHLGKRFWLLMIVVSIFNFSHFSETFLQLRAREVGVELVYAPLVMVLMNLMIAVASYPVGTLSDRFGRRVFLSIGFSCVIMADLLLAFGDGKLSVFTAITFWGIQMAMTQGMISTLVTDTANPQYKGTAFGVLNVLTGVVYLIASPFYGWVWDQFGGKWPFLISVGVTLISFMCLGLVVKEPAQQSE